MLFTTCADAEMDTQVTWACDFAERTDPTNLTVTIPADSFVVTRAAVLRYFDSQLVQFEESK